MIESLDVKYGSGLWSVFGLEDVEDEASSTRFINDPAAPAYGNKLEGLLFRRDDRTELGDEEDVLVNSMMGMENVTHDLLSRVRFDVRWNVL